MKRFDHARAHRELAVPAYWGLRLELRQLVKAVDEDARDLKQQAATLCMPWPEGLRACFESHVSEHLAEASRIVYCYGHWGSKDCWQQHGTYWKVSNYADQVLGDRLMLGHKDLFVRRDRWHSLGVDRGMLNLTQSTRDMVRSITIGPAVPETVVKIWRRVGERYFGRVKGGRTAIDQSNDAVWGIAEELARECAPAGLLGQLLTAGRDYEVDS